MSDIVERLRSSVMWYSANAETVMEAAAAIERLRAALEPLACTCDRANGAACSRAEANCAFWNARAALQKEKGGQ